MFVGHALLAFGIVALVARERVGTERALWLGVVAGLFATVPDVDMLYALTGVADAFGGSTSTVEAFWNASTRTHRSVTHSLVVALPAAVGFALWSRTRVVAGATLVGLVAVAALVSGALAGAMMGAFVSAGVGVSLFARRRGLGERAIFATALVGLASHPFGDLFTGQPPPLLYPFDVVVLSARVTPFADPTLNLLAAFAAELAAIWFGVWAFGRLSDRRLADHVSARATLGAGYAAAALLIPPPTMGTSYLFVFSVLAVGTVGVTPPRLTQPTPPDPYSAVATGLAAVSVAWFAYAAAFLVV